MARTEAIDVYLDGGVNWLDELRNLATSMPPADKMIVKSISASADQRTKGGGKIVLSGAVTATDVIQQFELAVRDESHQVSGEGTKVIETEDTYRLGFREEISIPAERVRAVRYEGLSPNADAGDTQQSDTEQVEETGDAQLKVDEPIPDTPPDESVSPAPSTDDSGPSPATESAPSVTMNASSVGTEVTS